MVVAVAAVDPDGGITLTRTRMPSHLTSNAHSSPAGRADAGETSIGTRHGANTATGLQESHPSPTRRTRLLACQHQPVLSQDRATNW